MALAKALKMTNSQSYTWPSSEMTIDNFNCFSKATNNKKIKQRENWHCLI